MQYEYTVIPAANRGDKAKGLKTPAERFAHAIGAQINAMAAEGWEYLRAEVLPSEERSGLTGRTNLYHNLLVFRRPVAALSDPAPQSPAGTPQPEYPVTAHRVRDPQPIPALPAAADPLPADGPTPAATPTADAAKERAVAPAFREQPEK